MLRLSVLSARGRLGTFTGALVALFAAAVLSMAWGSSSNPFCARIRPLSATPAPPRS